MAFPFEVNQNFTDGRIHQYKSAIEDRFLGLTIGIIIGICLALGLAVLVWLYLRKCQFLKRFKSN
jgi:hypothetical protein